MDHFYQCIPGWFDFEQIYTDAVNRFPSGSTFVEVGSFKGKSTSYMATEIANSGKTIEFYAVDTWIGSKEHNDPRSPTYVSEQSRDYGFLFREFTKNTEPVSEYIKTVRTLSTTASKLFKDESLEFVFIDAAHDYDSVCEDILHWLPKVKPGGILAGHDYAPDHSGVVSAVNQELGNNFKTIKKSWISYR